MSLSMPFGGRRKDVLEGEGALRLSSCEDRLWSSMFVSIVVCTFCAYVVAQGLNSGTTVFLDRIGKPAAYAGVMAVAFSVPAAIGRLLIGTVVDSRGRMKVAVCGACVLFVGTALPLLSSDLAVLTIARTLQGIGFSVMTTAAATAAVDVLPSSRLGEGIGYYGLAQSFAFAFGPALALFLVSMDPAAVMFAGMSVVAAFALVLSLFMNYERDPSRLPQEATYRLRFLRGEVPYAKPSGWVPDESGNVMAASHERKGEGLAMHRTEPVEGAPHRAGKACEDSRGGSLAGGFFERNALPGAIPMLVLSPVFGFGIYFMGLYGTSIGVAAPGLFFSVSAVTMIVARATSARRMNDGSPLRMYGLAMACGIVSYVLVIGASRMEPLYYLAGTFYGVSLGISFPVLSAVAVKNTRPEHWGVANAMVGVATDVGVGFSAVLWGILNDTAGFMVTLHAVIALFLVAFLVAGVMFRRFDERT